MPTTRGSLGAQTRKGQGSTMGYDELRERFALALVAAADSQDADNLAEIEVGYEELDRRLSRNADARFDKLHIALNFWDSWIDSRNHEWLHYDGLSAADWPVLGRGVAQQQRENLEIADERVLSFSDLRRSTKRPSTWTRLKGLIVGRPVV